MSVTLHIEASSVEEYYQILAKLKDGAPLAKPATKPAKKSEEPAATPAPVLPFAEGTNQSAPVSSDPNAGASGATASTTGALSTAPAHQPDDPTAPTIAEVRSAIMAYMAKTNEKAGAAPQTIALLTKYKAQMIQDIGVSQRADFIKECNA